MSRPIFLPLLTAFALTSPWAFAQSEPESEESPPPSESTQQVEREIEEIVVTGSRIRRDEYNSAAPIQIIEGAASREIGLVDTPGLLQGATQATGTQIDNTFTAFVLDNGPGSAQVNLRGLGAERVLLLLNSRRMAPGGVGGAPTSPDISTIPNIMIDRVELLLDGASSIYGSDAVAGVVNVIMRTDFEGLDVQSTFTHPDSGAGSEVSLGLSWGASGSNWSFGVAGEFFDRDTVQLKDRSFTAQCNRYIHEDENGRLLYNNLGLAPGTTISPCKLDTTNRFLINTGFGNVWYTQGTSNIGIPNFSETTVPLGFARFNPTINPVDTDGDGMPDVAIVDPDGNGLTEVDLQTDAYNFNGSERYRSGDLLSGTRLTSVYAYGDYDLGNEGNTSIYLETLVSRRETTVFSPGAQLFPTCRRTIPTTPVIRLHLTGSTALASSESISAVRKSYLSLWFEGTETPMR